MQNKTSKPGRIGDLIIVARSDFLFIAGSIAVIAGFFFPQSGHTLDVALIFCISLTAAVLIITFSARTALEVKGFALLVVAATMLRITLGIGCSKLILSQGHGGTIINLLGAIFAKTNVMLTISGFITLAVIIFGIVFKAARSIGQRASDFITDVIAVKQAGIDNDLDTGVINNQQALELRENISRESRFFVTMTGAARFILCAAVIELVLVFVNIVASMAFAVTTNMTMSLNTYITLVVGAGMLTQTSALTMAVASRYLVHKSSAVAANNTQQRARKKVEVVVSEMVPAKTAELHETGTAADVMDAEWFDESQSTADNSTQLSLWSMDSFGDNYCYEVAASLIESSEVKTVLMAAECLEELAVTIPVNIAVRLVEKNLKCLLIDLDLKRGAISKVFDIDNTNGPTHTAAKTIETCINNLHVYPAANFDKDNPANIQQIIDNLNSQYDHIFAYAPDVRLLCNEAGSFAQAAMLFGPDCRIASSSIIDLQKMLIKRGCKVLEPEEILAEAV